MKLHWHKFFSEAPNCFNQKNHWHLSMWCDIHAVHSRFYTKGIKIYVFLFVFQKKNLCNCFAQILVKYFFLHCRNLIAYISLSLSLSPPIFNNFIVTIFFLLQFSAILLPQIIIFSFSSFLQFQQLNCHNFFSLLQLRQLGTTIPIKFSLSSPTIFAT